MHILLYKTLNANYTMVVKSTGMRSVGYPKYNGLRILNPAEGLKALVGRSTDSLVQR